DRAAHDVLKVDERARGDLAGDDGEAGGDERLACHAADRILRENRVEDRVGNLIGDLVGVAFGDRLRRKQVPSLTAHAARSFAKINGPETAKFITDADGTDRRSSAGAPRARACKSAWSTDPRGRASSEWRANQRRARAGAWRTSVERRAG